MSDLQGRNGGQCELCGAQPPLSVYEVPASKNREGEIMLCQTCLAQVQGEEAMDVNHWRCLNDSMWSQVPAVQVMAWRLLKRLDAESWAQDLLDMLYLDDDMLAWAEAGLVAEEDQVEPTRDCNGAILEAGDTVVITKDLDVKGTSMTAKRGTAVRGISLTSNPEHIEGRINGQRIVILSCYVKKS